VNLTLIYVNTQTLLGKCWHIECLLGAFIGFGFAKEGICPSRGICPEGECPAVGWLI